MAPAHDKTAAAHGGLGTGSSYAVPKMLVDPVQEMTVYVISGNHGLTAHVAYWNGHALLQLPRPVPGSYLIGISWLLWI